MKENKASLKDNPAVLAWLLLVFLACVWGLSFLFIKKVTTDFSALEIGAGRVLIAAITLLPWAIKGRKSFPKEKSKYFTLTGFLGFFFPAIIFAFLGSRINSSLAGTLNSTTPLFTLIVGALFFGAGITRYQVFGIFLGFLGSLVLILSGSDGKLNFDNPFALLALLATIMYGFNVHIIGKYLKGVRPVYLTAYSLLVVGALAFILLLFFTDFWQKLVGAASWYSIVYLLVLGSFNTALAVVIFNYVLQISSPLFGSSVTYLIPIVATIAGSLDGEIISMFHLSGMAVTLAGVYLINKK